MKNTITALFITLLFFGNASAQTILQALKEAYNSNVELNAERENLIVSEQDLKIIRSEYLPSATITTSKSQEDTNKLTNQSGGDASINDVDPLSTSIKLEQTLIDFGRGADYQKKKIGIYLASAKLLKKEQDILYKAIDAYSSLVAAKEKEDKAKAEAEIQKAFYSEEEERLKASEIVQVTIQKQQIEIQADAEAERQRRVAKGEADAILAKYEAEAEGIQKVLDAKAQGYSNLVSSASGDPKAAATLLMVEKIENMVAAQTEAIRNLKIDKITVWDSGNNSDGSSATSNFVSSLVQSLPPIHDVAKMSGVELPDYLGSMTDGDQS